MSYVLGIDLGGSTTTAAVARRQPAGWDAPELVRLGARSDPVPSVLHLAPDGALTVADSGRLDPGQLDAGRVARGFTRRIGDEVPMLVGGEPCPPQALTAVLAMWVVERVQAQEGAPAERVVLSHPASWGAYRRAVLHQALHEIGLARVTLLPEPLATAERHAARGWTGSMLGVYSLGEDDVEASVVQADGDRFRLLGCTAPVDPFGGADLAEAIAGQVQDALHAELRELRRAGSHARLALAGLRRECERAAERLAVASETEVRVPLPHRLVSVPVTRAELAERARPGLQLTVDALARAVRSCGLHPQQLDGVLLAGAAARLPLVAELVAEELPVPVAVEPDPASTVAVGAAVAAGKIAMTPGVPEPADAAPDAVGAPRPEPLDLGPPGPDAGPPPRPPVRVIPLRLSRIGPRRRRFGLVGGGS